MKQKRAYKYRFYPTDEQKRLLAHTFGCCRFVYNWALRKKTDAYYKDGQRLSYKDMSALLTALKKQDDTVWLADVSSVPPGLPATRYAPMDLLCMWGGP